MKSQELKGLGQAGFFGTASYLPPASGEDRRQIKDGAVVKMIKENFVSGDTQPSPAPPPAPKPPAPPPIPRPRQAPRATPSYGPGRWESP